MFCNKCFEFIRGDCLLTNDICVFCYYKTDTWDSNGMEVKKEEVIVPINNYRLRIMDWLKIYNRITQKLKSQIEKEYIGTLIKKKIKGKFYYYLTKRKKDKLNWQYLGKDIPFKIQTKINYRLNLIQKLKGLKEDFCILEQEIKLTKQSLTYPSEFNDRLKDKIRKRDKYKCLLCSRTQKQELQKSQRKLTVHHIDYDKQNCKEDNLATLCGKCHPKKKDKKIAIKLRKLIQCS